MEQLIADIETYAAAAGTTPQAVLRQSIAASGRTWAAWKSRTSGPTLINADRIRAWMAEHPPAPDGAGATPPDTAA